MENIGELMQTYATKEVLTVVAALATAWMGWKAATKTVGMAKGFATKASFAGLTSALLLLAGFGGLGMGIGELASRGGGEKEEVQAKPVEIQLTNKQLVKLATSANANDLEEILKYATARDKAARESTPPSQDAVAYTPVAFANERPYEELPFEVKEQDVATNDESIMTTPMAWTTIGLGLASLIGSFGVFTTRKTYNT